ncbi:efflux RND transporter permease subunit [uncultured Desulfobacter sp.]|uniref:efflux RND transporter permease subunit n=1 Tax=uncultured Desulfobacter sp. TaxID=240139 RepID=UPI002AA6F404|nr:efflux RND transporter permease subunit [uncultured Desulfobacter sp.]
MKIVDAILNQRRLILTLAGVLSIVGAFMWTTMTRQEDPRLPDFWGQIVAAYPGADAETVERLVLEPMEDALAEVSDIKKIEATAYDEIAVVFVELRGGTEDFSEAWDDVREALETAYVEFPDGAAPPSLDDDMMDQDSVVLAVSGDPDPLVLLDAARKLKDGLLALSMVSRVEIVADPGEQVTLDLDDAVARRIGVDAVQMAKLLNARNQIIAGGSLRLEDKTVRLRPLSEFSSVAEIARTQVMLSSGSSIPLGEIARVHLGPEEPATSRMRVNGTRTLGIAIVPRREINLVNFGQAVREKVDAIAPALSPVSIQEVTFQPKRTEARLGELGQSLLLGILIVGGILILAMGLRMGLVVASVVPLVTLSSLAVFAWAGGVLHQVSIASLVLALGMLVDNAIVVAENIQWRLDRGARNGEAAGGAVRELAVPLAGATATTMAAFVPMLIAKGLTAEFTKSIPIVIMLTLSVSYLFALLVTPVLSRMFLKPRSLKAVSSAERLGSKLARFAVRRSGWVILAALAAVASSFAGAGWVHQQFFPASDRNQCVMDLKLAEGSHLDATDAASQKLEQALLSRPEVVKVTALIGRSVPKFYYNINRIPYSPHLAQLIVETRKREDLTGLLTWTRNYVEAQLPGVELVARKLKQGPPVGAPVEVRIYGNDLEDLNTTAAMVAGKLKKIGGVTDVRHDLGPGAPTIRFNINDAAASRYGLSRADLAQALYGRTRGLPVGELHVGEDPIPVVIRSSAGENLPMDDLASISVAAPDGQLIPLAQVAGIETAWRPAAVRHWNTRRVVTVSSQLMEGYTFSDILAQLEPGIRAMDLPPGVEIGFGGDAEGSGEANTALMKTFPIGLMLLLAVLLAEFNSFRCMFIILATVPLSAAGVVPGLLIGGQPFGFMSMLGIIALVGIVVNNAIVLLEVVENRRRAGAGVGKALEDAVSRRIRPILLTTATTVAGLLPLALSSSTLWPPLASAMISGLLASTLLTLVVVPALYRVMFSPRSFHLPAMGKRGTGVVMSMVIVLAGATAARADGPIRVSLARAMEMAMARPAVASADALVLAAQKAAEAERRTALWPVIGSSASHSWRDRDQAMETPFGAFLAGERNTNAVTVKISQPIFDPAGLLYSAPAARDEARAESLRSEWLRREMAAEAGDACLYILEIDARIDATEAFLKSLAARLDESREMVGVGRALEADALKIELAHDQAHQDMRELKRSREIALVALARAVNYDGHLEPEPAPDLVNHESPSASEAFDMALARRPDLAALKTAIEALEKRRLAVHAGAWPRLDADAAWVWNDPSSYTQKEWCQVSLTLTWTPFAAGTRGPQAAAIAARTGSLRYDLEEARQGINLDVKSVTAAIENGRDAFRVEERGVVQSEETLRVERARYRGGRSTTNDLLDAEAQVRERRTMREIARLRIVRAWIRLWMITGEKELPF